METLLGAFDFTAALHEPRHHVRDASARRISSSSRAALLTAAVFSAARKHLVVAPNRQSRNYALYVIAVLLTLLIATALENELSRGGRADAALRRLSRKSCSCSRLHVWIAYRTEPWIIQLGASSLVGSAVVAAAAAAATDSFRVAHGVTLARDRRGCSLSFGTARSRRSAHS